MSDLVLKHTKCDTFCKFESIIAYCFDCPALMCNYCKDVMHNEALKTKNHNILNFENLSLNWNDKSFILDIFDDKNMGEIVYCEVSRKIEDEKNSDELDIFVDPDNSWVCSKCTIPNPQHLTKCRMCHLINISDTKTDSNSKLMHFQLENFKHFVDLENIQSDNVQINIEHIMQCYLRENRPDLSIIEWYSSFYSGGKCPALVDKILKKDHGISLFELNRKYYDHVKTENEELIAKMKNDFDVTKLSQSRDLLDPDQINSTNKTPIMSESRTTEDDVWNVIISNAKYSNPIKRMLMVELELDSSGKVDILQIFMNNEELGSYLKESHSLGTINLNHVKQVICDQVSFEGALFFLRNECELCCNQYPMPEMCQFMICQHEFCKGCVFNWLKQAVESGYPCSWTCPSCESDKYKMVDKNMHYSQLRNLLSADRILLNIFEEKLFQEQIMTSKNFHWCPMEECTNGFESEGLIKIQCPSCNSYLCANCGRKWHDEHEGKTCIEFEMWMLKNDPNLSKLLQNIGIECPGCGMRYAMAAGGCLHFDCKACGVKFCGGCDQFFVTKCDKPKCEMTNFHGHHPRNCLYFLRDRDANELEQMLKTFDYPKLQGKPEKQCQFMITNEQLKDIPCNKEVHETTGLCESHYKEYLVQFINRYKIDPADFADANSLNLMLFQMVLPKLTKLGTENDNQFKERLIKTVKETCLFFIPKGAENPA